MPTRHFPSLDKRFSNIHPEDYKNPDMIKLERDYLKESLHKLDEFKRIRKLTELAVRIGRLNRPKKGKSIEQGINIFSRIVAKAIKQDLLKTNIKTQKVYDFIDEIAHFKNFHESRNMIAILKKMARTKNSAAANIAQNWKKLLSSETIFYEYEPQLKKAIILSEGYNENDFKYFLNDPIKEIEEKGKSMRAKKRELIINFYRNPPLPHQDESRVKEVRLRSGEKIVMKRVRIQKIHFHPAEEFLIMDYVYKNTRACPKPIAFLTTFGNYYLAMEKVQGRTKKYYQNSCYFSTKIKQIEQKEKAIAKRLLKLNLIRRKWRPDEIFLKPFGKGFKLQLVDWEPDLYYFVNNKGHRDDRKKRQKLKMLGDRYEICGNI